MSADVATAAAPSASQVTAPPPEIVGHSQRGRLYRTGVSVGVDGARGGGAGVVATDIDHAREERAFSMTCWDS